MKINVLSEWRITLPRTIKLCFVVFILTSNCQFLQAQKRFYPLSFANKNDKPQGHHQPVSAKTNGLMATVSSTGSWSGVNKTAPHNNAGGMLLLSDGSVIVKSDGAPLSEGLGTIYDKLTPDASGSYANGSWSSIAPMHHERLYYSSQILKDGRVYVAGGEYTEDGEFSGYHAEVYNPLTNVWTNAPDPGLDLDDANSEILDDGRILQAAVGGNQLQTYIYNPLTNSYAAGPSTIGIADESAWLKLPDNSILFVNLNYPSDTHTTERYIPSLNKWIADAPIPVSLYDAQFHEAGGAVLLPDGRGFFIGSTSTTAFYTPSGSTAPGTWSAGPTIPNGLGAPDAPAAMMVNGKVLCAFAPAGSFNAPTYFYEFDPSTNNFTQATAPGGGTSVNDASYSSNMLDLPDGSVLYGRIGQNQYYIYKPSGSQTNAGKPVINTITQTSCNTYTLKGTGFNGISEGATYGDDWQMATNYPVVRLMSGNNVYYCRTTNWNSTGVMRGSAQDSVVVTLPANLPGNVYSMVATANGIASDPVTFTNRLAGSSIVYVNANNNSALHDGSSWANAFTTLQDALQATTVCSDLKQIWIAKGTYYPDEGSGQTNNDNNAKFQLKNNVAIYGGFAGSETNLTQRDWKNNITILSGDIDQNNTLDNNNAYTVVSNVNTDKTVILDGVTITGGNGSGGRDGGGMININASPTISNCIFTGNAADIVGAGMYNNNSNPSITNSTFSGNISHSLGGGLGNESNSNPVIINCTFLGNTANRGSGISNSNSAPLVTNCSFSGNSSLASGGSVYNYNSSNPVIINCIIWNNKDAYGTGSSTSAIFSEQSSATISYSLVQNVTTADGNNNVDGISNASDNNYPLFENPVDPNTAPTTNGDLRLQCFSPAIDKGNNAANIFATDLDNNSRIINNIIDLGAYEKQINCNRSTVIAVTSSSNPSCKGSPVMFSATVTLDDNSTPVTTGSVSFSQEGVVLANNIPLDGNGQASFTVDTLGAGTHTITATYNASTGYLTSSASINQTVNAAPVISTTNIIANTDENSCNASVAFGYNVTITGTLAPTVVYKIGNAVIASPYTFPSGKTKVRVTATNSCGSTSQFFFVTVRDKQAPYIACKPGATKAVSGSYYTVMGTEFDAVAADNCGTPVLIYSLTGATSSEYNFANTSLAGVHLNRGTTTIHWKANDANGNRSICTTVVKVIKGSNLIAGNSYNGVDELKTVNKSTQLKVIASPNPTTSRFTLKLQSGNYANCNIVVVDITGRRIEELHNVSANSTVQIGGNYYPGVYVAEVTQGNEKVTLKLVKGGN